MSKGERTSNMGFAIGYIKCLLLMFICSFLLIGLTLIVLSTAVFQEIKSYSRIGDFVDSQYYSPLITLMVAGSVTVLISVFGTIAVLKENNDMLITFAGVIFVLFICEVTVGSMAFMRSNDIGSNIKDKMSSSLSKYSTDKEMRKAFDSMQNNLECCGVSRPSDYALVFGNSSVPSSCCTKDMGHMCTLHWSSKVIHQGGCFEALSAFITRSGVILGSISVIAAFIGIIGIVFTILLVVALFNDGTLLDRRSAEMGTLDEEHKLTQRLSNC